MMMESKQYQALDSRRTTSELMRNDRESSSSIDWKRRYTIATDGNRISAKKVKRLKKKKTKKKTKKTKVMNW
jgi:hypothetical protein